MVDLIRPKPVSKDNVKVLLNSTKRINYAESSKLWFVTEIYPTVVLLLSSRLQTFRWFKVTDNEVYFTISKILKNAIEIENE